MKQQSTKSTWPKIRKLFNDIHLWLGLSSGLILIVVCFTGTVYVFNTELTEANARHLYKVAYKAGDVRQPVDAFLKEVEELSGGRVVSVQIPHDPESSYRYAVRKKDDQSRFGTAYMVNPYTGEILGNSGEKNSVREFMSTMFSLHRWLLLDKVENPIIEGLENRKLGSYITGTATIMFTLGCITGLVIWFPRKIRTWRQGLKIKWRANWKRVNHDLHNSLAFYALIFLLLMGLTGPQWSFEWYREGLQKTLGTYKPKDAPKEGKMESTQSSAEAGGHPLSIAALLEATDRTLLYEGDYTVALATDSLATASVFKTRLGFFAPAAGDRLTLDQYSGEVLKSDIFRDKPFNERIAGSIKALHLGNVYGTFTKILYFLASLIATSLPVTGTLIWLNKMKKNRAVRTKPVKRRLVPDLG